MKHPPVRLPSPLTTVLLTWALALVAACAPTPPAPPAAASVASPLEAVFTVQAEGSRAIVRAVTRAPSCPAIAWDGKAPQGMSKRALPGVVAARGDSGQSDNKPADFPVLTCEAEWPAGARNATVEGRAVPAPSAQIRRIVIVADTGCRMKASEKAFQACNDAQQWPFGQVARSAAATRPDLVIHIGDIHYRESPCPTDNSGCARSPWGYGYDAWAADLFQPAGPLLAAAPWVFVRGNHESCFRAGQGWFRFIDTQPWTEARSCNQAGQDADADFSEPYAVPVGPRAQLIVFDSSKVPGKALAPTDKAYGTYLAQMNRVAQLAQARPNSFFMSHHPVLGFGPSGSADQVRPGNGGLQSVLRALQPERLFPPGVELALHGHVHLFEAISFASAHPATLVLGNSGSQNEGGLPARLPPGAAPYRGAVVDDFVTRSEYGFATLDRVDGQDDAHWLLTEYTVDGEPVYRCDIVGSKSRCKPA